MTPVLLFHFIVEQQSKSDVVAQEGRTSTTGIFFFFNSSVYEIGNSTAENHGNLLETRNLRKFQYKATLFKTDIGTFKVGKKYSLNYSMSC